MWYKNCNKTLYIPKTEFNIQRHGADESVSAFHHLEAARRRYPQDLIIELSVEPRYIEYQKVAGVVEFDGDGGALSYSERCCLKPGHNAEPIQTHNSWWTMVQSAKKDTSTMSNQDSKRIASSLAAISTLLENAIEQIFSSQRTASTSWEEYVDAIVNKQAIPKKDPEYYCQLLENGNAIIRNCAHSLNNIVLELHAYKNSEERLSDAIWDVEKAMEQLIDANNNDRVDTRGKKAMLASENILKAARAIGNFR